MIFLASEGKTMKRGKTQIRSTENGKGESMKENTRKMKSGREQKGQLLLMALACLLLALGSRATARAATKTGFVESGSKYYYYDENGRKATGLTKIGSKTYYFDASGVQRTSWRRIGSSWYYFYPANGSRGKMMTKTWVDGIYLKKSGKAKASTTAQKRKLAVMVHASQMLDALTKPAQSKAKKRKIMFEYTKTHYGNVIIPDLTGDENWDIAYAEFLFNQGYGDCYAFAAGFAYFMNAIGYNGVWMEHSGTHAWVHYKSYYYDPHWAESFGSAIAYHVPSSLSGVGKRPHWRNIFLEGRLIDDIY